MNGCAEYQRLVNSQQEAFGEWYRLRSALEALEFRKHDAIHDGQLAADEAYRQLRHWMDAVISHTKEHTCHIRRSIPARMLSHNYPSHEHRDHAPAPARTRPLFGPTESMNRS